MDISKLFILAVLLMIAMFFDMKSYKVPNFLIFLGYGISFVFRIHEQKLDGIIYWGIGILIPVVTMFVFFLFRVIGAGDIKLFSVIGSFIEVSELIRIIILAFIIGAVMSLIQLIRFRNLNYRLQYLANYIQFFKQSKSIIPYYNKTLDGRKVVIPFTIAITISAIYIMGKTLI